MDGQFLLIEFRIILTLESYVIHLGFLVVACRVRICLKEFLHVSVYLEAFHIE